MASGVEHDKVTVNGIAMIATVATVGAVAMMKFDPLAAIPAAFFARYITPDHDQEGSITFAEALVYRFELKFKKLRLRIGRLLGPINQQYWHNYALAIPHRNSLSHMPLLGTLIRIIVLLTPLFFWDIYQSGIPALYVAIAAMLYIAIPRVAWRGDGRAVFKVLFLLAPAIAAVGMGYTTIQYQSWMIYFVASWTWIDFLHLWKDGFKIY